MLNNLITNIKSKIFGPSEEKQHYGDISTSFLSYVSPPLLLVSAMIIFAVIFGGPTLIRYFETNVYLNGMIIAFLGLGIIKTYGLNFEVLHAAYFCRKIEIITNKEEPCTGTEKYDP